MSGQIKNPSELLPTMDEMTVLKHTIRERLSRASTCCSVVCLKNKNKLSLLQYVYNIIHLRVAVDNGKLKCLVANVHIGTSHTLPHKYTYDEMAVDHVIYV